MLPGLKKFVSAELAAFEDRMIQAVKQEVTESEVRIIAALGVTEDKLIAGAEAETDKVVQSLETTATTIVTQVVSAVTSLPGQIIGGVRDALPHFPGFP